jgi:hypothetical protein
MRKLIALFLLAAVGASAQVTNTVNISNSLLGPVTNVFTNTQISVGEAIITGAVFNANFTNEFNQTIVLTNEISVGSTTINNTNTIFNIVTNIIETIAVNTTNIVNITNVTQVITSGVSSINFTSAVSGAITFEGEGLTQTGTVFNFRGGVAKLEGQYGIITTTNGEIVTVSLPTPANAADQFLRSDGSNVFWSTDRFPLPSVGTNFVNFSSSDDNVQDWAVPAGVSNVVIYAWGGGGGGGAISLFARAGGYAEAWHTVGASETLKVVVANSGHSASTATPFSGWPGGGTNSANLFTFGGGFSGVYRSGTNWNDLAAEYLVIAGGGGAGGSVTANGGPAGGGGGLSGGDSGAGLNAARGGTQTEGGLGWNNQTNNFAGTRFFGGGGAGANVHGGGGGYWGGGAGTNAVGFGSAGGGSGFVGTNALYGFTIQANSVNPPYTDNPYYLTGRAVPSTTATLIPGQITIRW